MGEWQARNPGSGFIPLQALEAQVRELQKNQKGMGNQFKKLCIAVEEESLDDSTSFEDTDESVGASAGEQSNTDTSCEDEQSNADGQSEDVESDEQSNTDGQSEDVESDATSSEVCEMEHSPSRSEENSSEDAQSEHSSFHIHAVQ